jgi:hypothetical protein
MLRVPSVNVPEKKLTPDELAAVKEVVYQNYGGRYMM